MRVSVRTFATPALLALVLGSGPVGAAAPDPIDTAPTATDAPTTTANAFFPDDTTVNITDCVSALPRPECGSRERGGWRQGAVFGVVVAGLLAVGARLAIGIRRRDRQPEAKPDDS